MAAEARRSVGDAITAGTGLRPAGRAADRRAYLDHLKVGLIAAIIAIHAVLGYASLVEVWTYSEVREATLAMPTQMVLFVLLSPFGFFMMALLFLVAGLLTPRSVDRKGSWPFVRDRLLRLGVPFAVYVLVVQPVLVYPMAHAFGAAPGSFFEEYLGDEGQLDAGPLWFVGTLLVYSVVYAAWRAVRPGPAPAPSRPISLRPLLALALVVAVLSWLVRLRYPYGGESGFFDLNMWEWPGCIAAFGLGVVASRRGWVTAVPDRLARQCAGVTVAAVVAMTGLLVGLGATDSVDDALGGRHWTAAVFVVFEAALVVCGPVWTVRVAQRHLDRSTRWTPSLSRTAYGAFMLQTFFLLGLAVAVRPVGVPAEVKALVVALGAVIGSFGAARILVDRVPGFSRVL